MNPRDKWSSPYEQDRCKDLGFTRSTPPEFSSFPMEKLVALVVPRGWEESIDYFERINDWAIENHVKYREVEVLKNGTPVQAYLFKKSKHALYFKLTWG